MDTKLGLSNFFGTNNANESQEVCSSCQEGLILKDKQCSDISIVENCIKASKNKCVQCLDGYKPSEDGITCIEKTNYGLTVGVPVSAVSFVVILILFTVFNCSLV
mgnify:CR=1 FL=1